MIHKTGNLFDPNLPDPPDIRLFTANGVVKRNGELVMGAGAAKMAKALAPSAPKVFGRLAREEGRYDDERGAYAYGLLIEAGMGIGAFQTKYHYREPADINLIALAAHKLALFASHNPDIRIAVNFPGVGLGRLNREQVTAVLDEYLAIFPVEIWRFSPGRLSTRIPAYRLPSRPR